MRIRMDGLVSLVALVLFGGTLSGLLWSLTPHPRSYHVAAIAPSELIAEQAPAAEQFAFAAAPERATP